MYICRYFTKGNSWSPLEIVIFVRNVNVLQSPIKSIDMYLYWFLQRYHFPISIYIFNYLIKSICLKRFFYVFVNILVPYFFLKFIFSWPLAWFRWYFFSWISFSFVTSHIWPLTNCNNHQQEAHLLLFFLSDMYKQTSRRETQICCVNILPKTFHFVP